MDNHSSGTVVTDSLMQPTRKHRGPRHCFPIWSCSRRGLPCRRVLPPARCALTAPFHPYPLTSLHRKWGGIFSVALSVGSRPPGITWHLALWSPDFPPSPGMKLEKSDCLADSQAHFPLLGSRIIAWRALSLYLQTLHITPAAVHREVLRPPGRPGWTEDTPVKTVQAPGQGRAFPLQPPCTRK